MRTGTLRLGLIFVSAITASAQDPEGVRAAMDASLAKQRSAASAMQDSLAQQRSSLEKQDGHSSRSGFFVLPPPAPLGAAAAFVSAACEPLPASEVDRLVEKAARRQDVDEGLLRGVMRQESSFRPCAVSPKGAMGLMQLMPATASQLGIPNPFDAQANVDGGARLLRELLNRYGGDLSLSLGAYNAGPSEVDAAAGIPKIPETQDYVKRILSMLPGKQ